MTNETNIIKHPIGRPFCSNHVTQPMNNQGVSIINLSLDFIIEFYISKNFCILSEIKIYPMYIRLWWINTLMHMTIYIAITVIEISGDTYPYPSVLFKSINVVNIKNIYILWYLLVLSSLHYFWWSLSNPWSIMSCFELSGVHSLHQIWVSAKSISCFSDVHTNIIKIPNMSFIWWSSHLHHQNFHNGNLTSETYLSTLTVWNNCNFN